MSEKQEIFFDASTIMALVGLVFAIPTYFILTVFNPKYDLGEKIVFFLVSLPSLIFGLFIIGIFLSIPFTFIVLSFEGDAWPVGVIMIFFLILFVVGVIRNVGSSN